MQSTGLPERIYDFSYTAWARIRSVALMHRSDIDTIVCRIGRNCMRDPARSCHVYHAIRTSGTSGITCAAHGSWRTDPGDSSRRFDTADFGMWGPEDPLYVTDIGVNKAKERILTSACSCCVRLSMNEPSRQVERSERSYVTTLQYQRPALKHGPGSQSGISQVGGLLQSAVGSP